MSVATGLAVAGTAASIASSAYAASQAGSSGYAGAPPVKFNPLNLDQAFTDSQNLTSIGYNLSDANQAAQFPGLVAGNQQTINQTNAALNGPLDPTLQNNFAGNALQGSLSSTGAGSSTAGVGPIGSASGNAAASSIGNQTQQYQDVNRANLQQEIAANPERQFTPSGSSFVDAYLGNVAGENQYNIQKYDYQTQKAASSGGGGGF